MINIFNKDAKITATIELKDISEQDYEDILLYIKMKTEKKEADNSQEETKPIRIDELHSMIDAIYSGYEKRPKDYILMQLSALEFVEEHPELGNVSLIPVGRILSSVSREHGLSKFPIVRGTIFHKVSKKYVQTNIFTVPVRCATMGDKIRILREMRNLSQKELAELIHYPMPAIEGWEKNHFGPSDDAIKELIKCFGPEFKKIFDQEEK